jgi:peptide/nickel transport system substrate-binding protein
VIVGVQAIPACFDVEQHRASCLPEAFQVHLQVYDTLLRHAVRTDAGGHRALDVSGLQPGMAQSWDMSADQRTCNLHLRRGLTSAAGHELTAHDVKWSWERAFALGSWGARAARRCGVSSPDAVRVVQPYMVQFRLEAPHPLFPAMLATPLPPIYDLEAVREHCPVGNPWGDAWLRKHSAGFGPYALEDGADAEEAGLSANMRYWDGAPRDKRILMRALPNGTGRADALGRGSIDLAGRLPASQVKRLAGHPGVQVRQFAGLREVALRLDPGFAPFNQPGVRQALALAIPYGDITRQVFEAQAQPVRAEQDLRAARSLLREAAYGSGFRFTLYVPQDEPELQAVARAIQLAVMPLNLNVVVEAMSPALFARDQAARHLPVYLEQRQAMTPLLAVADLEPLPPVETLIVARPHDALAARSNVEGFVVRPDGHPRYAELHKR